MIWPMGDGVLGPCLKNYGEWSEGENIIMSQFISDGDTVIDIGANIGTTVLSLSKQVGENGKFWRLNLKIILLNVLIPI